MQEREDPNIFESTSEEQKREILKDQQKINSKENVPPFIEKDHHKENIVSKPTNDISTYNHGAPRDDESRSMTVGVNGPILLQDITLLEKHQDFNRERIPERVVHAKGTGAHGYFEVTNPFSQICKAKFISEKGKKTPIFVRFSQVVGEKGSQDTDREIRGFAIKFYTEEGNFDMVGNDLPVFFIRDGIKFPDLIHSLKKNPHSNLPDLDTAWDFTSLHPESVHAITMLYSDRGTPASYRNIHSFGNHTFKFINENGELHYAKFHVKAQGGFKTLTIEESKRIKSEDPDYLVRDLHNYLKDGKSEVKYDFCVQTMSPEQAQNYKFNILDITKVWYQKDFPLQKIGEIVLNRNPSNFFAEVEQVAFSPSNLVPGIEVTNDKILQARLFAYNDAQMHRLGTKNFKQIPINCPFYSGFSNFHRDGTANHYPQGTGFPNYTPNSFGGPHSSDKFKLSIFTAQGQVDRHEIEQNQDDFEQANLLYSKVMDEKQRANLIKNICDTLKDAKKFVR
jgi:catalase